MPAQEPAGGDKDDDVDLPSEDTDGSRGCFLPAGEAQALLACGTCLRAPLPDHKSLLDPSAFQGSKSACVAASWKGWGGTHTLGP